MEKFEHPALIFSGTSGVGKDYIIEKLMRTGLFERVTKTTTRETRGKGEATVENVTAKEFKGRIDNREFAAASYYLNALRGITKNAIDKVLFSGKIPIIDYNHRHAKDLKAYLPNAITIGMIRQGTLEKVAQVKKIQRRTASDEEKEGRIASLFKMDKEIVGQRGNFDLFFERNSEDADGIAYFILEALQKKMEAANIQDAMKTQLDAILNAWNANSLR